MSFSPNSSLLNRTIELQYANKKRSTSLKWLVINIVLLLLFLYDLCGKCAGYTSALHWAELCGAAALGANAALHALRLARRAPAPAAPPSPAPRAAPRPSPSPPGAPLSPARSWRAADASPPPSPPSPPSPRTERLYATDEFISDHRSLANYLRQAGERARAEAAGAGRAGAGWGVRAPPAHYQLAALDSEGSALEEPESGPAPGAWRRLLLDPARVTEWNQNLRLWLHVTILQRLVREMARVDEALGALGLGAARLGHVGVERLQKLPGAAALPALGALLPYLEPFADQRYAVQRVRELAQGGGLSAYRWSGGGSDWDEGKPTDAELLLRLLAAYLDSQLPAPFSAAHLSAAPAPPPRHAGALAIHRTAARPPHYVLALGEELVEAARGRNNLLHTLLLFVAALARRDPPALQRVHLGPAGLNMLWIIGR